MKITSNQINEMVNRLKASKTNQERAQCMYELAYFTRCMRDEIDRQEARTIRRDNIFLIVVWTVVAAMVVAVVAVGMFS